MARTPYSATVTTRPSPFRVAEVAGRTWIVDASGEGVAAFSGDDALRNANSFLALISMGQSIDTIVAKRTADIAEERDAEAGWRAEAEDDAREAKERVRKLEDDLRTIAAATEETAADLRIRASAAVGDGRAAE